MENLKTFEQFMEDMKIKKDLMEKLEVILKEKDIKDLETKIDVIVKFAKENGYDASVEDFSKLEANKKELDDNELGLATGGGKGSCWFDYVCGGAWNNCLMVDECHKLQSCDNNIDEY